MTKVFVYGTLLEGEGNHPLIAKHINTKMDAIIPGKLYHLGGFPGVRDAGGITDRNSFVLGEVYEVDDDTLAALDRLEGCRDLIDTEGNLYNRVTVPAYTLTGQHYAPVYVYEYNSTPSEDKLIEGGSWKHRNDPTYLTDFRLPEPAYTLDDDDGLLIDEEFDDE